MAFFNKMYEWIAANIPFWAMLAIVFGLLFVVFFASMLKIICGNKALKYKTAAQKATDFLYGHNDHLEEVEPYMAELPKSPRYAWLAYYEKRNGRPSDYMSAARCVDIPAKSWLPLYGILLVLLFGLAFCFTGVWYAAQPWVPNLTPVIPTPAPVFQDPQFWAVVCTMFVVTVIFYIILMAIHRSVYKKVLKTHIEFVAALDNKVVDAKIQLCTEMQAQKAIAEGLAGGALAPAEPEFTSEYKEALEKQIAEQLAVNDGLRKKPPEIIAAELPLPTKKIPPRAVIDGEIEMNDLFERIDNIIRERSPLKVMKEAAVKLQAERHRPQYQSADMQRRFNEVLARLLKAMQSRL